MIYSFETQEEQWTRWCQYRNFIKLFPVIEKYLVGSFKYCIEKQFFSLMSENC